jgi:hypothetical protein
MIYPKSFFDDKKSKNKNGSDEESFSIFVIMPFAKQFTDVYNKGIKSLARKMGWDCVRADEVFRSKPIMEDILGHIHKSGIIIADTTSRNPNVFYELGISHTTKEFVVIISQSLDDVPFDLRHLRCFLYSPSTEGLRQLQLVLFKVLLERMMEVLLQQNENFQKLVTENDRLYKKLGKVNPMARINESSQKDRKKYYDAIDRIHNTVSSSTLSKSIKEYHTVTKRSLRVFSKTLKQMEEFNKKMEAKIAKLQQRS